MLKRNDVPLAPLTTFGVGGAARHFIRAANGREVAAALSWAQGEGVPVLVLGGGSNLIVADRGFPGLVLAMGGGTIDATIGNSGPEIRAGAGCAWDDVVALAAERGWAGLECLSGIPGQVGATPIQNVGAYGQEIKDTLLDVELVERATGARSTMSAAECGFGYRDSVFKREARDRYVVVSVRFGLRAERHGQVRYGELERALGGTVAPVDAIRRTVIALRRAKSMVLDAADPNGKSAGSFFMNPVVATAVADEAERRARARGALHVGEAMPRFAAAEGQVKLAAGWLIERAGFSKGYGAGPVGLSSKHALALVNRGGASAADVLRFAAEIRAGVLDRLGVGLTPEPELVGFSEEERALLVAGR